jgi:hypothetical protein
MNQPPDFDWEPTWLHGLVYRFAMWVIRRMRV